MRILTYSWKQFSFFQKCNILENFLSHSLNNLNMELKFKQHLSLYKTVLTDQLIGYCDAPGHLAFLTEFHKSGGSNHPQRYSWSVLYLFSKFTKISTKLQLCKYLHIEPNHLLYQWPCHTILLTDFKIGSYYV